MVYFGEVAFKPLSKALLSFVVNVVYGASGWWSWQHGLDQQAGLGLLSGYR